ncbi:MAG: hypothetical protein HS100_19455 [Anaerolineales bacterium]|nr:MAG: hypothetical protein EDM79_17930 [Chloroflexota bacterium]MBE7436102.1 hypothetical protein [Anaerolineales bacterium]
MELFIDILGWIGSGLYLLAFGLNSARKVKSDSLTYQGMNIFAGIIMTYYTFSHGAYSATALNTVWALIGVATLINKRYGGRFVSKNNEERIDTTN